MIHQKKKHILVACNHLAQVGGSEMYTYDLAKSLLSRGDCIVEYFTHNLGLISSKMEKELGVKMMTRRKYDLIIASHTTSILSLFGKGPIIQVVHGTVPVLERPSIFADYHVAISEEIADDLADKGFDSKVVLNGLDLASKCPKERPSAQLKTVLSLCQSESANERLRKICERLKLNFKSLNKHKNPTLDVVKEINESDLVVGIGRSVYDAMACGRPCVILDERSYNGYQADGYLRPNRFWQYVKKNCSGRYLRRKYKDEEIVREIRKYDPKDGEVLREIAESALNMEVVAKEILELKSELGWNSRIKKWRRFLSNFKFFKQVYFYPKMFRWTNIAYFDREAIVFKEVSQGEY